MHAFLCYRKKEHVRERTVLRYRCGNEVRLGDRVEYGELAGEVTAILYSGEIEVTGKRAETPVQKRVAPELVLFEYRSSR